MAAILFAVLSTVGAATAGRAAARLLLGALLLGAPLTGCAGDADGQRPMHIATRLENQAVKVEVDNIPTGREVTGVVLIDAAGRETPARKREVITREEGGGGNAGPGIGIGASGGSSSGIRPFISLGYIFGGGGGEVRRSRRMMAEIPLEDPQAYAAGWRDWRVVLRYRDRLDEPQQVSVPAPAP